jgi:hypothetical protein
MWSDIDRFELVEEDQGEHGRGYEA